jgi:O-antigen/teichoic acid export membrane protein
VNDLAAQKITDIETSTAGRELDGSLVHGLAWTAGVKWAAQGLSWFSTLLVARLLSPDDYGLVGMATVYLGMVTLLTEFGVGTTIVTLRELDEIHIAQLNGFAVLLGLAGFALSCIAAVPLGRFFHSSRLPLVVMAMSATFIIASFQSVPAALLQRDLRFKLLSLVDGTKVLVVSAVMVILAWLGFHYWTLVIGSLLSTLTATLLILSRRTHRLSWPHFSEIRHATRFSWHILVSRISWYAYSNSDFVVCGRVLGQQVLGAYSIAWNLANIPVEKTTGVLNSVTPALFSAVQKDNASIRRYLLNLTEVIALVTLPLSVGLGLVARDFVLVVLGPRWEPAIAPLQLLALYVSVRSITPLIPIVLNSVGESRFNMWNNLVAAVVLPAAFYMGSRSGSRGIAAAWLVAYPLVAFPLYFRAFQKIELPWTTYLGCLRAAIIGTLAMVLAVVSLPRLISDSTHAQRLAVQVLAGGAAYILAAGWMNYQRRGALLKVFRLLRSTKS